MMAPAFNRASLRRVLAALATFCAGPAQPGEFCSTPLPLTAGVEPALDGLSMFTDLVAIPDFDRPLLDVGATSILTIEDGQLVPFDDPPLDRWNRLLPVLVRWPDGEVWAYPPVRPRLYRLSPEAGAFVPLLLDERHGIENFSGSGMTRRHEDRTQDEYGDGVPPLYGYAGDELVEITRDDVRPVSLPEAWPAFGRIPIVTPDLGIFLPARSGLWFRRDEGADWQEVARLEDVQSLYGQSPFEMIEVHRSEDGNLWVMLEDRVLVGRMGDEAGAPAFGYQVAGDIIIHEPTGQVLVFANEPLAQDGREEPPLVSTEDALYEARPKGPRIVVLYRIGGRHVVELMSGGLAEVTDDLQLRPIPLPEEGKFVQLDHSALLDRFILHSHMWDRAYTSADLVRFSAVAGTYEPIRGLAGDLPAQEAVFVNSASSGYLIGACKE